MTCRRAVQQPSEFQGSPEDERTSPWLEWVREFDGIMEEKGHPRSVADIEAAWGCYSEGFTPARAAEHIIGG